LEQKGALSIITGDLCSPLTEINQKIVTITVIISRPHHSTTYLDEAYEAYYYRLSSVVCRSVTIVNPAKTAELIKMPFGVDSGGPMQPCFRWGPDHPMGGAILRERALP